MIYFEFAEKILIKLVNWSQIKFDSTKAISQIWPAH